MSPWPPRNMCRCARKALAVWEANKHVTIKHGLILVLLKTNCGGCDA